MLGAVGAFIVDRDFTKAAGFATAGAILTFFGFMHGEAIGIGRTPLVALSYLLVAAWLYGCAKYSTAPKRAPIREIPGGGARRLAEASPSPARRAGLSQLRAGAWPPAAPG